MCQELPSFFRVVGALGTAPSCDLHDQQRFPTCTLRCGHGRRGDAGRTCSRTGVEIVEDADLMSRRRGDVTTQPTMALRVLVIDDEQNIRKTMRTCLEAFGCS